MQRKAFFSRDNGVAFSDSSRMVGNPWMCLPEWQVESARFRTTAATNEPP